MKVNVFPAAPGLTADVARAARIALQDALARWERLAREDHAVNGLRRLHWGHSQTVNGLEVLISVRRPEKSVESVKSAVKQEP